MNNLGKMNFCEQYLNRVINNIPHGSLKTNMQTTMLQYMQGIVNNQQGLEMPRNSRRTTSRMPR